MKRIIVVLNVWTRPNSISQKSKHWISGNDYAVFESKLLELIKKYKPEQKIKIISYFNGNKTICRPYKHENINMLTVCYDSYGKPYQPDYYFSYGNILYIDNWAQEYKLIDLPYYDNIDGS